MQSSLKMLKEKLSQNKVHMESLNIDSYINLINKLNIKQILKYF